MAPRYDLNLAAKQVTPDEIAQRPPSLWRYHEILPVLSPGAVVTFGEGMTPLIPLPRLGEELGLRNFR